MDLTLKLGELENPEIWDVMRPYPNEHAARLQEPSRFDSFRRTNGSSRLNIPESIAIIWGHPKGAPEDSFEIQALRFPVKTWTAEEARKWLKEHKYSIISFEPAKEEGKQSLDESKDLPIFKYITLSVDNPDGDLPCKFCDVINLERVVRFKASDDTLDRYDEVILPEGWDMSEYSKNPVVMQFHDYRSWPIGHSVAGGVKDGALYLDIEFDPPEVDESADLVFRKVKHGTVKAGSVGFDPLMWVTPGMQNKGIEVEALFQKYPKAKKIYLKSSLLEFTICPIPANPNALCNSMKAAYFRNLGVEAMQEDKAASEDTASIPDLAAISIKLWELQKRINKLLE